MPVPPGLAKQRVAVQSGGEDLFQQPHTVGGVERIEPQPPPGLWGALDDAGADFRARGVGVKPDPPGRGRFEGEGEAGEHLVGAQPYVGVAADFQAGAEVVAVQLAHPAVGSVAGDDQVGVGELGQVVDLAAVLDIHPQLGCASGEDAEQGGAGDAVAVPAQIRGLFPAADLLVLPQGRGRTHRLGAVGVVAVEVVEQVVPIPHAPAVGGPRRVAFDDGDVMAGIAALGRDREVQRARSTAGAHDLHGVSRSGCTAGRPHRGCGTLVRGRCRVRAAQPRKGGPGRRPLPVGSLE